MPMLNIGSGIKNNNLDDLNQKIDIVFYTDTRDEEGNIIRNQGQTRYKNLWAKVLPYASKISMGYAEKVNEINYRVVIRYKSDIEPTDVIRWRNKKLTIISTPYDAESLHKWLIMECRELVEGKAS